MSDWRKTTLGDICHFQAGNPFGKDRQGRTTGTYPFIKVSDMNLPGNEIYIHRANNWISEEDILSGDQFHPAKATVFAKIGIALTYNRRRRLTQSTIIDNNMMSATPHNVNPDWFYYLLCTLDFNEVISGTALPYLTIKDLSQVPVLIPPASEQRAIASTLGSLDDKIELNRQMNETLEAMARAIFKDWFVDFGPTRAKMEGREPYLAPETWSLFPDRLNTDGKPEGWEFRPIGDQVSVTKGLSYKGAGLGNEGLPLHNLNSVMEGGGYKVDGLKYYSGEYKQRHLVSPDDLIVANTEQGFEHLLIGYSALIPRWAGIEGLFSHHLFKVEPKSGSPLTKIWLHFALSASWIGDKIRRFSNGTTVNMLPKDAFELPEVLIPPKSVVAAFESLVAPLMERQKELFEENQALAQTRNLLLPKLMSGEIQVNEPEEQVQPTL